MGSASLEILGLVLCLLGWLGLILACGLPMWQVTAFLDHNIVTAQITWKGLWMTCVVQSTGHMQCKVYESVLALSSEVQAARALTVGAALLALIALFVTLAGAHQARELEERPGELRVDRSHRWVAPSTNSTERRTATDPTGPQSSWSSDCHHPRPRPALNR
ncbi:Claudin-5 [Fukomys damarensis]|uniref:Claudin n=1 Tax=Fukomys damarensis TaxID=885580 RepID=A0A091DX18_FUKDA|nr:Claudin-5 [Fukomys damarensis]